MLFRSNLLRLQASTLATLLHYYGLLSQASEARKDVSYGMQFCRAYSWFMALCPDSKICFERAWMLCEALLAGDELMLENCGACGCRYVHDRLSLAPRLCPGCREA